MKTVGVLFAAFAMAIAGLPVAVAQDVDPKNLVGEWWGRWSASAGPTGNYYLTILRVDGNKVYGKVELTGARRPNFSFEGTLEGNVLRYSSPDKLADVELVITGNTIAGHSVTQGFGRSEISARKKK
jgi:hypothetical protein